MTHEQKPESAEFRTREAQLSALTGAINPHQEYPMVAELLTRHIAEAEAEARGAAEQRRKDAKGAEPVGYRMCLLAEEPSSGPWLSTTWLIQAAPPPPMPGVRIEPLYARPPANAAVLEARVKELEGALSYLKDEALRFADMYPQSSDMRNTFGVFASKIAARAAAIREGGEHG